MSDIGRRGFVAGTAAVAAAVSLPHRRGTPRPPTRTGGTAGTAGAAALGPEVRLATPPRSAAARFRDSVGVNVHWTYYDTPYGQRYPEVRRRLVDLGIRFVRGDATRALDLFDDGIRTLYLVDPGTYDQKRAATTTASALVDRADAAVRAGAVHAFEGANEPDLAWVRWGYSYGKQNYLAGVQALQRQIWLRALEYGERRPLVYGPAVGGTYWGGGNPLLGLGLGDLVDAGTFHPYPTRNTYTPHGPYAGIGDYYWQTDFPSSTLDLYPVALRATQGAFPGKPMVATESGWSTFNLGPEEAVHAAYTVRMFLENFRLGIPQTYAYELLDEFLDERGTNREAHFGLLRRDLSPKPAYWAVQGMLASTRPVASTGTGPAAATPALSVRVPVGYSAKDVHGVLVDRGEGLSTLVVWRETAIQRWTVGPKVAPRVAPVRVTHPDALLTVSVPGTAEVEAVGEHAPTGVVTVRPVHATTTTVPLRDYPVYVHVRTR